MRNTTKLKHLLLKYDCTFQFNDEIFNLILIDKQSGSLHEKFSDKTYALVLGKAYRFFLKEIK